MSLNHQQKKYIQKNIKKKSISQISSNLNLSPKIIEEYLKYLKKDKYKRIEDSQTEKNQVINKLFDIKSFIKKNLFFFGILGVLVIISYANSLSNNFVSDDNSLVLNAPSWNLDYVFGDYSLILRKAVYFIDYKIFGLNPFFFRLPNVFFHLGTTWLSYILIAFMFSPVVGFLTASVFAVHPILSESVSWISAGGYLQYSFFFLLSILYYLLYKNSKNNKNYIFSIILFLLSLLSSDKASPLFLVFFLFEISFGDFKKNWKRILPFAFLSFIFLFFYFGLGVIQRETSLQTEYYQAGGGLNNPFFQIPIALTSYFELIFWPSGLTLYHSEMIFSQVNYLIRLSFFLIFIFSLIYFFKKNKKVFFWSSFFIITLLPTLTPLKIAWIVAERYVYLGALGIFTVLSLGFYKLTEIKRLKLPLFTFFIIAILALSFRTIIRNVDWQNEDNLWIATGKTSPSSPNTHNNLGDVYGRHGDLVNASLEFQKAIKIKPDYADAYHNLGNVYRDMGKIDDATKNYQMALKFNPRLWQSYQNLSAIYFSQKKYSLSLENMGKASELNPTNLNLRSLVGIIYAKTGNKEEARKIFTQVLQIDPQNKTAQEGMKMIEKAN